MPSFAGRMPGRESLETVYFEGIISEIPVGAKNMNL
jgi:hypothetical protein